jgi:uncharacterized OB-fold protein
MAGDPGKFIPRPTPVSKAYWEGCRSGRLLIQYCPECSRYQFYPRSICTQCMSGKLDWVQATGQGTVETWTIVRRPVSEAYAAQMPFVIALIRLEEGPVMMSHVTGCDVEKVHTGMRVGVVFEAWSEQVTLPLFTPVKPAG